MRRLLRRVVLCSAITAGLSVLWTSIAFYMTYQVVRSVTRGADALGEVALDTMLDLTGVESVDELSEKAEGMEATLADVRALTDQVPVLRRRMERATTSAEWCPPAREYVALFDHVVTQLEPVRDLDGPIFALLTAVLEAEWENSASQVDRVRRRIRESC